MNMDNCVSEKQRIVIRDLIMKQEIKKSAVKNPDIYEKRKDDREFWILFANDITEKLIKDGYHNGFHLRSRGLIQGQGYNLEIDDDFNNEKFYIYTNGGISDSMNYVPEKGLDLNGFQLFLIIMIFVYLVAFIIIVKATCSATAFVIVIALGVINIFALLNS